MTKPQCRWCQSEGPHTIWCPVLDIDEIRRRLAIRPQTRRSDDFSSGYALGLIHAQLQPSMQAIERALRQMSKGDLSRLAHRLGVFANTPAPEPPDVMPKGNDNDAACTV